MRDFYRFMLCLGFGLLPDAWWLTLPDGGHTTCHHYDTSDTLL